MESPRKKRETGATVRHAISKMKLTDLVALGADIRVAADQLVNTTDLAGSLSVYDGAARLALLAAFRCGGNGQGKPNARAPIGKRSVDPVVRALADPLAGVVFTAADENQAF
jgi:hypothetical protein